MSKIDKAPARLIKKRRKTTQITSISNEKEILFQTIDIKER